MTLDSRHDRPAFLLIVAAVLITLLGILGVTYYASLFTPSAVKLENHSPSLEERSGQPPAPKALT